MGPEEGRCRDGRGGSVRLEAWLECDESSKSMNEVKIKMESSKCTDKCPMG